MTVWSSVAETTIFKFDSTVQYRHMLYMHIMRNREMLADFNLVVIVRTTTKINLTPHHIMVYRYTRIPEY